MHAGGDGARAMRANIFWGRKNLGTPTQIKKRRKQQQNLGHTHGNQQSTDSGKDFGLSSLTCYRGVRLEHITK